MIFWVNFKTVEAEESRLLSWGSFLLLLLVLDLCYAESFQEKARQTDSQPVMNNNDLI